MELFGEFAALQQKLKFNHFIITVKVTCKQPLIISDCIGVSELLNERNEIKF